MWGCNHKPLCAPYVVSCLSYHELWWQRTSLVCSGNTTNLGLELYWTLQDRLQEENELMEEIRNHKEKKTLLLKTLWKTRENCTLHQFPQHIVPLTLFTFDGSDLIAISVPDWLHYLPADLWGCFCSLTQTPPPKWIEAKRPSLRFIRSWRLIIACSLSLACHKLSAHLHCTD